MPQTWQFSLISLMFMFVGSLSHSTPQKKWEKLKHQEKIIVGFFCSISTLIHLHPFQLVMLGYWFI